MQGSSLHLHSSLPPSSAVSCPKTGTRSTAPTPPPMLTSPETSSAHPQVPQLHKAAPQNTFQLGISQIAPTANLKTLGELRPSICSTSATGAHQPTSTISSTIAPIWPYHGLKLKVFWRPVTTLKLIPRWRLIGQLCWRRMGQVWVEMERASLHKRIFIYGWDIWKKVNALQAMTALMFDCKWILFFVLIAH